MIPTCVLPELEPESALGRGHPARPQQPGGPESFGALDRTRDDRVDVSLPRARAVLRVGHGVPNGVDQCVVRNPAEVSRCQ